MSSNFPQEDKDFGRFGRAIESLYDVTYRHDATGLRLRFLMDLPVFQSNAIENLLRQNMMPRAASISWDVRRWVRDDFRRRLLG